MPGRRRGHPETEDVQMEGQMLSQQRPQSPESLPPQSQISAPGITRNITHLRDELAQHRGVQRVVTRILKSTPNT